MTQTPTDALRLVNPHKDITENLRQAAVDLHPWFVGDAKTFSVDCALPAYLNEAADEIERLRAAAPASPLPEGGGQCSGISGELSGWQDISTAPKDGTPILAWCVHPHARWAGDDRDWAAPVVTSWTTHNGGGWTWHGMIGTFTHWMPLPAAPTGAK